MLKIEIFLTFCLCNSEKEFFSLIKQQINFNPLSSHLGKWFYIYSILFYCYYKIKEAIKGVLESSLFFFFKKTPSKFYT